MLRILVAEDFDILREDLCETLEAQQDMTVAGSAATGGEITRLALETDFDLVLMDIEMENITAGITATEVIREKKPEAMVIFLTALGLERFQIRVNNRKLLSGFYAMLGLTDRAGDIMRVVDKLPKIGPGKVRDLLTGEDTALTGAQADEILRFISITGSNIQVLSALEEYKGRDGLFDTGLDELNTVVKYLGSFGVPEDKFAVDLTIARGLDYYTGTVYETFMTDHPEIGSVCSGGRYDNLAEYYTDKQLPGVGISIGLTRLFYVLEEQGYLNNQLNTAPADVLVLPMTDDLSPAIAFATQLRGLGVRAQLYTEQKKFKQKMGYADKLGIPFAAFLGEDEIAQGKVSLKDMASGEQRLLDADEAAQAVLAALEAGRNAPPIREKE